MTDLTGIKFGRLIVLSHDRTEKSGSKTYHHFWNCRCDCGNTTSVRGDFLQNGRTQSCGCYGAERRLMAVTKHGKYRTRLHTIWQGMKQRCYSKKNPAFKDYGCRGITVCEEWLKSFSNFQEWALNSGYCDNLTIDRIDNDKGYCPDNCQWITIQEQQAVGKKRPKGRIKDD